MIFKYYKPKAYKDKWGFRKFKNYSNKFKPTFLLHTPVGHFWLWLSKDERNQWPQQA